VLVVSENRLFISKTAHKALFLCYNKTIKFDKNKMKMENKKENVAVIIIIVIVVLITAGSVGWLLAKKSQSSLRQSQTDQMGSVSKKQSDPQQSYNDQYDTRLSSLDIYKNLKIPFIFKYGEGLKLDEMKGGITLESSSNIKESEKIWIIPSVKCEKLNDADKIKDQPWCYFDEKKDVSIRDWCESRLPNNIISKSAMGDANEVEETMLYSIIYKTNSGSYQKTCITKNRNDYVTIIFPKSGQYEQISGEIISSFQFVK